MHGDTAPGEPLHVRHGRVIVFLGAMGFLFLKNGEDTTGRIVAFGTGAYGGPADENAVTINVHRLLWDTHQGDNWTLRRELRIPPILARFEWPGWFARRSALGVERGPVHRVGGGGEQRDSKCNGG